MYHLKIQLCHKVCLIQPELVIKNCRNKSAGELNTYEKEKYLVEDVSIKIVENNKEIKNY